MNENASRAPFVWTLNFRSVAFGKCGGSLGEVGGKGDAREFFARCTRARLCEKKKLQHGIPRDHDAQEILHHELLLYSVQPSAVLVKIRAVYDHPKTTGFDFYFTGEKGKTKRSTMSLSASAENLSSEGQVSEL